MSKKEIQLQWLKNRAAVGALLVNPDLMNMILRFSRTSGLSGTHRMFWRAMGLKKRDLSLIHDIFVNDRPDPLGPPSDSDKSWAKIKRIVAFRCGREVARAM